MANPTGADGGPLPGRIGPYRVVARLASGGTAEVYLAARRGAAGVARAVIIKRLFPHLRNDSEFRSALVDEARVMARLRHANVVAIQELGEDADGQYLVMEYLAGATVDGLLRALRPARLGAALAVHLISEVCAGLHAAHAVRDEDGNPLGVIHRDVSPQNVFVTFDGEVKVLDFGIARFRDRATRTDAGLAKGKLAYMAPEQFHASETDRRVDIYATGVMLHELLTGESLFGRDQESQVLHAVLHERVPRPSELRPRSGIPPELDDLCMRALARKPSERFQTALEMRQALREILVERLDPSLTARDRLAQTAIQGMPDRFADVQELARRTREELARPSAPTMTATRDEPSVNTGELVFESTASSRSTISTIPPPARARASLPAAEPVSSAPKPGRTDETPLLGGRRRQRSRSPHRRSSRARPPMAKPTGAPTFALGMIAGATLGAALAFVATTLLAPGATPTVETTAMRVRFQSQAGGSVRVDDELECPSPCDVLFEPGGGVEVGRATETNATHVIVLGE